MNVSVTVKVSKDVIKDLLTGAIEGGSNYWGLFRCDPAYESSITPESSKEYGVFEGTYFYPMYSIDHPGYCLQVRDVEDAKTYMVSYEDLENGLKVISEKYPRFLSDIIQENWDAETADAFMQCAVFRDIIYG